MKNSNKFGIKYATFMVILFIFLMYIGNTLHSTLGLFIGLFGIAFLCIACLVMMHVTYHLNDKE